VVAVTRQRDGRRRGGADLEAQAQAIGRGLEREAPERRAAWRAGGLLEQPLAQVIEHVLRRKLGRARRRGHGEEQQRERRRLRGREELSDRGPRAAHEQPQKSGDERDPQEREHRAGRRRQEPQRQPLRALDGAAEAERDGAPAPAGSPGPVWTITDGSYVARFCAFS
jgi:hypothetical protein